MNNYFELLYNIQFTENQKTLYVIDSNYLSYAMQSVHNSEKYFNAMEKVIDQLYIPFIVYIESIDNIKGQISDTKKVLKNINTLFEAAINLEEVFDIENEELIEYLKDKIIKLSGLNSGTMNNLNGNINYKGQDGARAKLDEFINNLYKSIKKSVEKMNEEMIKEKKALSIELDSYDESNYNESIKKRLERLNKILSHEGVVGSEYTSEKLENFNKVISERMEKDIPPGYKDKNKTNNGNGLRTFGKLSFQKSYGDAILWLDLIEYIKNSEYENVVIVSDDTKTDWSEKKGESELKKELKIEFLQTTGKKIIRKQSLEFIQEILELSEDETKGIRDEINEFVTINSEIEFQNTIIVRAKKKGFNEVFLGEDKWYSVYIKDERIPFLKYIAVYQTTPISKITHYAEIDKIVESPENPSKKMILFKGKAIKLTRPIPLGFDWNAMQSNRYTYFEYLFNSYDIDHLLAKDFNYYQKCLDDSVDEENLDSDDNNKENDE